ncbi:MAG: metal ABC transporter ATP-binding protein [Peptococcaceae bacterium]|nr:metal ABC transporter ATP-binding protein [Peptococcaceae bacterium]
MNNSGVLEINELSFSYGCHTVLDKINLKVNCGDIVAITGPNGSGKTTLLKLILGQLKPDTGWIKLYDNNIDKLKNKLPIGYLSQKATHFNQQFPATAREVVTSGLAAKKGLFKAYSKDDLLIIEKTLLMVNMSQYANQLIGSLSGGQQQKVFLARALVSQPDIIILDEPVTGLDIDAQKEIYRLLADLNQNHRLTALIVSHELEGLESIATHQVCLDKKMCSCACHKYLNPLAQIKYCEKKSSNPMLNF